MGLWRDRVATVVLALASPSTAAAAGPVRPVELTWSQDDATCISAAELIATVERALARSVFSSRASRNAGEPEPFADVIGSIGKAGPDRFEAHLVLQRPGGEVLATRTLVASGECRRLDEGIAVVVALMIDGLDKIPLRVPAPAPPGPGVIEPPAPRPEPGARSAEPPPVPPPAPPAPPRRARIAVTLGLGGDFSYGLLPHSAGSGALRGEVAVRGFVPLALTLRGYAPATGYVSPTAPVTGVGGTFAAWTAELSACPSWPVAKVRFGGCAGVGAGQMILLRTIDGLSVLDEGRARPLVLLTVLLTLVVPIAGPLSVRAEGGAWVPLLRDTWGVGVSRSNVSAPPDSFEVVRGQSPVVPVAGLSLEVKLGS
jgi:hypothetical protein